MSDRDLINGSWKPLVINEDDILTKFYDLKQRGGYENDCDFMRYLLNLMELEGGDDCFLKGRKKIKVERCSSADDGDEQFNCNICDEFCPTKRTLALHKKTYHSKTKPKSGLTCTTCGESFDSHKKLKSHVQAHNLSSMSCDSCGKLFAYASEMLEHASSCRIGGDTTLKDSSSISCRDCPWMEFDSLVEYNEHIAHHSSPDGLGCDQIVEGYLDNVFIPEVALSAGATKGQPGYEAGEPKTAKIRSSTANGRNRLKYHCDMCSKSFTSRSGLSKHKSTIHLKTNVFKCDTCNKIFNCKRDYLHHIPKHEEISEKCHLCDKTLLTKQAFKNHLIRCQKNESMLFSCQLCSDKTFETSVGLIEHFNEQHSGETPIDGKEMMKERFNCYICQDVKVASALELVAHFYQYHPQDKPFKCRICTEIFGEIQDLSRHRSRRNHYFSDGVVYHCNICPGVAFDTSLEFATHFMDQHDGDVPVDPRDVSLKLYLPSCHICDARFSSPLGLVSHTCLKHPGIKPFKCIVCEEYFDELLTLKEHRETNKHFPFACEVCSKAFVTAINLRMHKKTHNIVNQWVQCDLCPKKYPSKSSLRQHRDSKHNVDEKSRTCDICGKKFSTDYVLKCHKKMHMGGKYKCDLCSKEFTFEGSLKDHVRIQHTGFVKQYCCHVCGKTCNTNVELKSHYMVHDVVKAKNFACELCDKRFRRQGQLTLHMKMHREGRKYSCEFCGKAFLLKVTLKQHITGHHTKERPWKCSMCPSDFNYSGALYTHMKLKHNGKKLSIKKRAENYPDENIVQVQETYQNIM